MTYADKHIVEAYSELFEGLNSKSKIELIENLSKSLNAETNKENKFYKSLGHLRRTNLPKKLLRTSNQAENLERKKSSFNAIPA